MSSRTKLVTAIVAVVLALACGGWAWFLAGQSLSDADQWSSVMAGFAALVFGVTGLLLGWLSLRSSTAPESSAGRRDVSIGGDNSAPVITGDNNTIHE